MRMPAITSGGHDKGDGRGEVVSHILRYVDVHRHLPGERWVGGHDAVWLEDFFVDEAHRGRGVGRRALSIFDDEMARQGKKAVFVDVIPRNERALSFYRECGSDHLNMVQLRKNYDRSLDKDEHVDGLGMRWRRYWA